VLEYPPMGVETTGSTARVFDFDDTLLGRERITRLMGLVVGKVRPQHVPHLSAEEITQLNINHGRVEGEVKGRVEKTAFDWHAGRRVYPGVKEELEKLTSEGVDIYGNTGRPNKGAWVDMTHESLDRQGIGTYFRDIAFTPKGIKTAVSKAHRLWELSQQYEQVVMDEDDPRTVRFLATVLPDVQINYIQYGTSGLLVSRRELEAFPNVRRVAVFSQRNS